MTPTAIQTRPTLRFSALPGAAGAHAVRLRHGAGRPDNGRADAVRRALAEPFELRPGGRWSRLLACLAERGPMREGDLFRATDPREHPPRVERARVNRAMAALCALELVEHVDGWGWTLTARGLAALPLSETSR